MVHGTVTDSYRLRCCLGTRRERESGTGRGRGERGREGGEESGGRGDLHAKQSLQVKRIEHGNDLAMTPIPPKPFLTGRIEEDGSAIIEAGRPDGDSRGGLGKSSTRRKGVYITRGTSGDGMEQG